MPGIRVAIVEGADAGREIALVGPTLVGRDPAADFLISDTEVSGRHASLSPTSGGCVIEDLRSTNGTFVNGERITGIRPLSPGDRVRLGDTVLEVRAPGVASDEPVISPAKLQVTRIRQIPTVPMLVFVSGPLAGNSVPIGSQIVIGRDPETADVILGQDTDVSRRHAAFSPSGDGLTVQDLGSTNGTYVNGQRITTAVTLNNGDQVAIGGTTIDVRLLGQQQVQPAVPAAPAAAVADLPPNSIEVEGLVKQFGDHRAVDGINIRVEPGEIYGFLGPNGAGKSTTVHMLTTLLPPSAGDARIAGASVTTDPARVRATIGVALQAAALDPQLNSWEHMDLQMALQGVPKAEREGRKTELIERVGLTYAADRRVGGYSGGMKRRLDLALALVHQPRVLFLDEPTTGLDPQSRTVLWQEVARLVNEEGMTVFLTTQYLEEADVLADRVGIIDGGEIVAEDTPARLKAEIGRPTIEVLPADGSDWAAVGQVLSRFGELVTSAKKGVAVRLAAGNDELADVVRALDARGLKAANIDVHAPTLDDVFLIKTGRSIEGAGESAEDEEAEEPTDGQPEARRRRRGRRRG